MKPSHCHIVAGKHFLNSTDEKDYSIYSIREFIVHLKWDPESNNYDGDIALVVLESPIAFQHNIRPICLPSSRDDSNDIIGNGKS